MKNKQSNNGVKRLGEDRYEENAKEFYRLLGELHNILSKENKERKKDG